MSKRYETGTKQKVLACMARFAIRDQKALIDAYTPNYGEPDDEAKEVIRGCEANIRDFKKFAAAPQGSDK